jgi:hypothetical protein
MNKEPYGMLPRHIWLRLRIVEAVDKLRQLSVCEDWDTFKQEAKTLSKEILYCVTEWEKYYEEKKE